MNNSTRPISLEELVANPDAIRAAACRKSFYVFLQEFWDEICTAEPVFNWHIQYFCAELEVCAQRLFRYKDGDFTQTHKRQKALYDLLINIPPGSSKSIIFSQAFPAWCWINDPTLRFITVSYSGDISRELADYTRKLVNSARFKRLFPEIRFRKDAENKGQYKIEWVYTNPISKLETIKTGGDRNVTSINGSITGKHADIIIIDDPLKPDEAESTAGTALDKAYAWLAGTLNNRVTDKGNSFRIMIMQRLHENDPAGKWLEEAREGRRNLRHICLPATLSEDISPKKLIPFYQDGLLDPIRMSKDVLKAEYDRMGAYYYAGQYQQNPVPLGNSMFNIEKINIIDKIDDPREIVESVRFWDKAGTANGGDYTVGVLMHKMKNDTYIVSDVVRGQWAPERREAIIRQTAELDGYSVKIMIEQEPGSAGKETAMNTIRNLAGYQAEAKSETGEKEVRAMGLASQSNAGNLYIVKSSWNREYCNEFRSFPRGKHDDQVDGSSGAFNGLIKNKKVGTWRTTRKR